MVIFVNGMTTNNLKESFLRTFKKLNLIRIYLKQQNHLQVIREGIIILLITLWLSKFFQAMLKQVFLT